MKEIRFYVDLLMDAKGPNKGSSRRNNQVDSIHRDVDLRSSSLLKLELMLLQRNVSCSYLIDYQVNIGLTYLFQLVLDL